jgi:hypothetical protein
MHAIALDSYGIEQCFFVVVAMHFTHPRDGLVRVARCNPVRIALPGTQMALWRTICLIVTGYRRHSVRFLSDDQSDLAPRAIISTPTGCVFATDNGIAVSVDI